MFGTIDQIRTLLAAGQTLVLAGDEDVLLTVGQGKWIGGTIPYFMTADGGRTSRDRIFAQKVPSFAQSAAPVVYDEERISHIGVDAPDNGYTLVVLPAFTAIHQRYALEAPQYQDLFYKTIAGWIAGIHLDDQGKRVPKVFNGMTGEVFEDRGVALHVKLPASHRAQIGIVNIFEQGSGDEIRFPTSGFEAQQCTINGERRNFHEYFVQNRLDARLPLVANYCGAMINVSIRALDAAASAVTFYAPVFEGVSYYLARPVKSYAESFAAAIPSDVGALVFSCNCVLNYRYGELENQHTGCLLGPMTFGEIGLQLLNQTLVHVTILPSP